MKIPFKQTTKSGCGSYALANLFNDPFFLDGVAILECGETTYNFNIKLQKSRYNLYLETLFATCAEFTCQHDRLIDPILFELSYEKLSEVQLSTWSKPYLVSFKRPSGIFHCILVMQNLETRLFHVVDSMEENIIIMDVDTLLSSYLITDVCDFHNENDPVDFCAFFIKHELSHIFKP